MTAGCVVAVDGRSQSQRVVVECLKAFVTVHNEGQGHLLTWSEGGIDAALRWMLTDVDDRRLEQV